MELFKLLGLLLWALTTHAQTSYPVKSVYKINIESSLNSATVNYAQTAWKTALAEKADLLLIEMNTPGGQVSVTKELISLMGESTIPVVVWVGPEGASASSAGALLCSAAHLIYMAPGSNMGAATPILATGENLPTDIRSKAINDLMSLTQSLAETRGRNKVAFGKMITEARSYTAKEALEEGIINGMASTPEHLWNSLNGQVVQVQEVPYRLQMDPQIKMTSIPMDQGQQLLNFLANPSLAYVLLILGAALLYLEMQAPGGYVAGSFGILALCLAGLGFQVLPINYGALGLIALSLVLFAMEAFITSYGLLLVSGLISLCMGSLFLYRSDNGYLEFRQGLLFSVLGAVVIFVGFLAYFIRRTAKKNRRGPYFSLVGVEGVVARSLGEHSYEIKIQGERWRALCTQPLIGGDSVVVTEQSSTKLELTVTKK